MTSPVVPTGTVYTPDVLANDLGRPDQAAVEAQGRSPNDERLDRRDSSEYGNFRGDPWHRPGFGGVIHRPWTPPQPEADQTLQSISTVLGLVSTLLSKSDGKLSPELSQMLVKVLGALVDKLSAGGAQPNPPVRPEPPMASTMAVGEEGGHEPSPPVRPEPPVASTMAGGEECDHEPSPPVRPDPSVVSTMAVGEEGEASPPVYTNPPSPVTTRAFGEEGEASPPVYTNPPSTVTTMAGGEEGDGHGRIGLLPHEGREGFSPWNPWFDLKGTKL